MNTLTTKQAARYLGLPAEILIRMRSDSRRSKWRRGPPYQWVLQKDYTWGYRYKKTELVRWERTCGSLSPLDVADLLGLSVAEVKAMTGLQRRKLRGGRLIIDNNNRQWIWRRERRKS